MVLFDITCTYFAKINNIIVINKDQHNGVYIVLLISVIMVVMQWNTNTTSELPL